MKKIICLNGIFEEKPANFASSAAMADKKSHLPLGREA
jgi:hypothetical protein